MILEKQKTCINFAINECSISAAQTIFVVVVVLIVEIINNESASTFYLFCYCYK